MIPLWAPRFSPTLATAAAEIESNAPGRFRRFTDDNGRDSTGIVRKSILIAGQTARSKMLFPKDTPLLLRAATSAILAVATLLVLVPCVPVFRSKFGVDFSPLTSASFAAGILGGMGSGFAVGGPRFFAAVASIGPARGSPGHAGFVGRVTGRLEYRGIHAGCDVARIALKPCVGHGIPLLCGKTWS